MWPVSATSAVWWKSSFQSASSPKPFLGSGRSHQAGLLGLVLGDDVGPPSAGGRAHPASDRRQDVVVGGVEHLLGGVEAEAVEVELLDPVAGVLDEELARRGGVVPVEVDGVAPLVLVAIGEVVGRKAPQVVLVRSDVVVDHVQNHADADGVRGGDEAAKVVRATVEAVGGPQVDAVVSPAETARGVGDRHELDERDAQLAQRLQPFGRRRVRPLGGEGPDVQLVDDLAARRDAAPVVVGPLERARLDHLRRSARSLGLKARRGVGIELLVIVQAKPIPPPAPQPGAPNRRSIRFPRPRERDLGSRRPVDHDGDAAAPGRPDAQMGMTALQLGSDGKTPLIGLPDHGVQSSKCQSAPAFDLATAWGAA